MIAVFGASVTQQKYGYAKKLSEYFSSPVKVFGYGGMHLNNAGICFLDSVIEHKPTHCFIDWFSTGYKATNEQTIEYIDTIIYKFTKIQCSLTFLFLPDENINDKKHFYGFCRELLIKRGISFINIDSEIDKSKLKTILRDDIHTTQTGSNIYAKIIFNEFQKIKLSFQIPSNVYPTKYINIHTILVKRIFSDRIILSGKCEILGFLLTVGPHSGLVEIVNDNKSQTYNTWDRWCHYPRRHFNLSTILLGKIKIIILQNIFDTSSCNNKIDFTKEKKKLIIQAIYYVGDSLSIDNLHEGKKINHISLWTRKILGRLTQYKIKFSQKYFPIKHKPPN